MADEYSLSDVLERIYQSQLGLEAALMELPFLPHPKMAYGRMFRSGKCVMCEPASLALD
jgi:hypothetical protein